MKKSFYSYSARKHLTAVLAGSLLAKWLHEFEAVNRFEGDLLMISIFTSL